MVNLKTKSDKHSLDNEKRRQAIKQKEKAKLSQSQIIKQALSNASLNSSSSKKIIFDNDDENANNHDDNKTNGEKNCKLFDESDSEEEVPEIKEKVQFSGEKGFELLNLQSTYGNDERFKIDERFLDDVKENVSEKVIGEETEEKDEDDPVKEKKKMLNILESVLGEPVQESPKVKKRQYDMIRYDASKKEHEVYEVKPDPERSSKKKKLRKLAEGDEEEEASKPQVSKEKFYKVSGEIKNSFKEKEEGGQFSLLQTYGVDDVKESEDDDGNEYGDVDDVETENEERMESPQKPGPREEKRVAVAQGIWKESFFFESNDPRFKDSLEFINKKNSEEATEAAENYDQLRKKLKEILRLHMKKQLQKKDPFKNKVGGSSKKQLNHFRPKNKFTPSRRKPKV